MEDNFFIPFDYVFTYILMYYNMPLLCFHLPLFSCLKYCFMSLHSILVLSFHIDIVFLYYISLFQFIY